MVGLLIVSHSALLAQGLGDLVAQMAGGQLPLAAVGGAADGSLGTSADMIREAAERLVAGSAINAILVIVDLGSSIMSAELALEGAALPYRISDAPMVEGALLAAVEASIGAELDQVAAAAERARELRKLS